MRKPKNSRSSSVVSVLGILFVLGGNLYAIYTLMGAATDARGALHAVVAVIVVAALTFLVAFATHEFGVALYAATCTVIAGSLGALVVLIVNTFNPPAIFASLVADPVSATANVVAAGAAAGAVGSILYARRYLIVRIRSRS